MIHASFDALRSRETAIGGAYQYDTGQRIRMHGLPSPQELAQMDELLCGSVATVQAQFGYEGDSQSEPRLAVFDEAEQVWTAEIPDTYLTRAQTVHVYVYVMYGSDGERSRSKTMYTGSFTPISRPAPVTAVTPDQLNAWDALVAEVNMQLSSVAAAASGANAAAESAGEAADRADTAAGQARSAAEAASAAAAAANKWAGATADAKTLDPGSAASVSMTEDASGNKRITYGIPKGEKGDKGDTGPAGVTFRMDGTTLRIDTY